MWEVKTILHPTDFAEASEETHRVACQLARERKARLIVLHVASKSIVKHVEGMSELPPEEAREKLWEAVRQPRADEADLEVEHRLEDGDPVQGILRVAHEAPCDLIVMGIHERAAISRWFMGGVAEDVIRKAPCSVLIVKAPSGTAEEEQGPQSTSTEDDVPRAQRPNEEKVASKEAAAASTSGTSGKG